MIPINRDPTFLDYWRVVWRARWWLVGGVAVAVLLAFAVGRTLPRMYAARATVLPPKESGASSLSMSLGGMLTSALGGREGGSFSVPGLSLSAASVTTNQDVFVAVLRSRTMRDDVLSHFAKLYGPEVAGKVGGVTPVADAREKGIISLTVEAREPKLAAEVTNYYFDALDRMLEKYADQSMRRQEALFTVQLDRAAKEVEMAEQALLKFQGDNRILAVASGKGGEGGGGGAGARSAIQGLELQRELGRMKYTDQHPVMRELEKQIIEMKRQYSKNLFGTAMELPPEGPGARGTRQEFFVAAERMTPVQFAFLKLARNLQIQEAFYTTALQGLQQLKYGEGASFGRVIVLDPAIPPSTHVRPQLFFIVVSAAGAAFGAGILLTFFLEYVRRAQARERELARAAGIPEPPRPGRGRVPGGELTPRPPLPAGEPAVR